MPPKKRKAKDDGDDTLVVIKVKGDGTKTVTVDARFDVFENGPLPVIKTQIVELHAPETLSQQMNAVPQQPQKFTYQVFSLTRTLSNTRYHSKSAGTHASLALANLAALSLFLERNKAVKSTHHDWQELTLGFVKDISPFYLDNPDFNGRHALRHGDIGWGFDALDCVSLSIVDYPLFKLNYSCVYVVAKELGET